MDKIMQVYLCGQNDDSSHEEIFLKLPATPWELVDALDRLNQPSEKDLYMQVEAYYDFDCIAAYIPEKTSLSQLNELSLELGRMRDQDRIAFYGLLRSDAFGKSPGLDFDRLMDIACARDCCHIAEDVDTDEKLGHFLCENGFFPEMDKLSDEIYGRLDFAGIGRQMRMDEHGAYAYGCYVAADGDIPHIERSYEITAPEYTVMLELWKDGDNAKSLLLSMPTTSSEMDFALQELEIKERSEVSYTCVDCRVPQLMDAITETGNIAIANHTARMLDTLNQHQLSKYKAMLEVIQPPDLTTATLLIDTVEQYVIDEKLRSPMDVAKEQLKCIVGQKEAALLEKHLNLYSYGEALIEQDHGVLTMYGYFLRRDGEPILTPQQPKAEMEMKF